MRKFGGKEWTSVSGDRNGVKNMGEAFVLMMMMMKTFLIRL